MIFGGKGPEKHRNARRETMRNYSRRDALETFSSPCLRAPGDVALLRGGSKVRAFARSNGRKVRTPQGGIPFESGGGAGQDAPTESATENIPPRGLRSAR